MRTDAWVAVLTAGGLAAAEVIPSAGRQWRTAPAQLADAVRATVLRPSAAGALTLLLCLCRLPGGGRTYLLVGAGDPAVLVGGVPVCGCDACDDGSARLLEALDRLVLDVVSGALVHVALPDGAITSGGDGWTVTPASTRNLASGEVAALLAQARAGRSPHPVVRGQAWW